jgi:hypothetical protein
MRRTNQCNEANNTAVSKYISSYSKPYQPPTIISIPLSAMRPPGVRWPCMHVGVQRYNMWSALCGYVQGCTICLAHPYCDRANAFTLSKSRRYSRSILVLHDPLHDGIDVKSRVMGIIRRSRLRRDSQLNTSSNTDTLTQAQALS